MLSHGDGRSHDDGRSLEDGRSHDVVGGQNSKGIWKPSNGMERDDWMRRNGMPKSVFDRTLAKLKTFKKKLNPAVS